jgi:hypothetical protein
VDAECLNMLVERAGVVIVKRINTTMAPTHHSATGINGTVLRENESGDFDI